MGREALEEVAIKSGAIIGYAGICANGSLLHATLRITRAAWLSQFRDLPCGPHKVIPLRKV